MPSETPKYILRIVQHYNNYKGGNREQGRSYRGYGRQRGYRGRGGRGAGRGYGRGHANMSNFRVSSESTENAQKCYIWDETDHFWRNCPRKNQQKTSREWAIANNACFTCGSVEHYSTHCKQKN